MDPFAQLLVLLAQLPAGLQASGRDSNHFELVQPDPAQSYWWLDLGDLLHPAVLADPDAFSEPLDRFQLLLDLAEAAKAAEPALRFLQSQVAKINAPQSFPIGGASDFRSLTADF